MNPKNNHLLRKFRHIILRSIAVIVESPRQTDFLRRLVSTILFNFPGSNGSLWHMETHHTQVCDQVFVYTKQHEQCKQSSGGLIRFQS